MERVGGVTGFQGQGDALDFGRLGIDVPFGLLGDFYVAIIE